METWQVAMPKIQYPYRFGVFYLMGSCLANYITNALIKIGVKQFLPFVGNYVLP